MPRSGVRNLFQLPLINSENYQKKNLKTKHSTDSTKCWTKKHRKKNDLGFLKAKAYQAPIVIIILLLDNFRPARKLHIKGWSRLIFNLFSFYCFELRWIQARVLLCRSFESFLASFFAQLLKGSQKNKIQKLMNKIQENIILFDF